MFLGEADSSLIFAAFVLKVMFMEFWSLYTIVLG